MRGPGGRRPSKNVVGVRGRGFATTSNRHKLVYRRDGGTSLDVWIEGLDMCFNATRQMVKDEKDTEQRAAKGKGKGLRQV